MNENQKYGFDVWGFLHLPGVLDGDEIASCAKALSSGSADACRVLRDHTTLTDCLETILGDDYSLDAAPALAGPVDVSAGVRLDAGDPERNRRLRYIRRPNNPVCHGLRVCWVLAASPEDRLVVVPASHKRLFDPPADLLNGVDDMGMTVELAPEAGDLVILAATTICGVGARSGVWRLAESGYVSQRMMPSEGYPTKPVPDWAAGLTPEQQAIIGPRTTGIGGGLTSDGVHTRLVGALEETPQAAFTLPGGAAPDPKEVFYWDVRGYLPLRNIMDGEWLAAAHRAIDAMIEVQPQLPDGHLSKFEEVAEAILRDNGGVWPEETSVRLRGEIHRPRLGGLYELEKPHCQPFHRMIGYPPIVQRLNWMLGTGFKEFCEPMCCVYPTGTTGGALHGQTPFDYAAAARFPLGDNLNVVWSLNDEAPGFGEDSGGFLCIPGSHKACYDLPGPQTTNIELPQVHKPPLKAGDCLFFGAVAHGTTAWRSACPRRCIIQFIGSRSVRIPPGYLAGWRWSSVEINEELMKPVR